MEHGVPLLIKYVMIAIILSIVLPMAAATTMPAALGLAIAVTIVAYLVGDLIILPSMGNWAATIGDTLIAFATLWVLPPLLQMDAISFTTLAIASVLIGVGEFFFHQYLAESPVLEEPSRQEEP